MFEEFVALVEEFEDFEPDCDSYVVDGRREVVDAFLRLASEVCYDADGAHESVVCFGYRVYFDWYYDFGEDL